MIYYDYNKIPKNTPIWGFAYSKHPNKESSSTKKKPVLGVIDGDGCWWDVKFYELKKDGTRKKGSVCATSRCYADTYEEAVEGYNQKVSSAISKLEQMIEKNREDYI